jgi:hypothetical protein
MGRAALWHIVWDSRNACYQLSEQTEQGTIPIPLDVGSNLWRQWLERVPSFAFQSKEHRARGGVYWTAYRKMHGRLKRKYLGAPHEVTLARLEQVAAALAESGSPCATALITSPDLNTTGTPGSDRVQEHLLATKFFVPASRRTSPCGCANPAGQRLPRSRPVTSL